MLEKGSRRHVVKGIREKTARIIWKPVPFISESAVIPVLIAVPVVVFILFVWLIRSLSSIE